MTISRFSFPTVIHFGTGARRLAGPHLFDAGCQRPLIVTDKGLAALPLIAELTADLEAAGLAVAVYSGIFGNPTGAQVMNGAAAYKAHGPTAWSAWAVAPRSTWPRWWACSPPTRAT